MKPTEHTEPTSRTGRPRDASLDDALLDAALEVLSEVGYDGMTMDAVASRAGAGKATLYRRWSSKQALVLAAVRHLEGGAVDPDQLPDTGDLRTDLLALYRPESAEASTRRMRIVVGLASLLMADDDLADAVADALSGPWSQAHLALMRRAAARGEVDAHADLDTLSRVAAAMAAFHTLVLRRRFTRDDLETIVDAVLLPALRPGSDPAPPQAPPTPPQAPPTPP